MFALRGKWFVHCGQGYFKCGLLNSLLVKLTIFKKLCVHTDKGGGVVEAVQTYFEKGVNFLQYFANVLFCAVSYTLVLSLFPNVHCNVMKQTWYWLVLCNLLLTISSTLLLDSKTLVPSQLPDAWFICELYLSNALCFYVLSNENKSFCSVFMSRPLA